MASGSFVTDSLAAGMVRALAPALIPSNGAHTIQNLVLGDDGPAYRRGGSKTLGGAAFGTGGLRMVWDGYLAGGARSVIANAGDFGVLASDDASIVNVGGPGLTLPGRPVAIEGLLFAGASAYGGSRKTAGYSTGTISVTKDSTTIVGAGTAWVANVDAGMVLTIGSRLFAVKSVTDNTHLELYRPFTGATAAGQVYSLDPVAAVPAAYNPGGKWVVAGNRLLSLLGDRIAESLQFDSTTWDATNEWKVPGAQLLGGVALHDTVLVFTTAGVFALANLDFDLTDAAGNAQQALRPLNHDLVLWGDAGIATWENAAVVPAVDGAWLVGATGAVDCITASIAPLWREYVDRGYQPGQATIFGGHYLLPVLDSGGSPVDLLVCRLDRPVEVRGLGKVWPWTQWRGAGARVAGLAVRESAGATREPMLLAAERDRGYVLQLEPFMPSGLAADYDGTAPIWELVTRAFALGELGTATRLRARYELQAATAVATIKAWMSTEQRPPVGVTWGSFTWGGALWQASTQMWVPLLGVKGEAAAPESDGDTLFQWRVAKQARLLQLRLRGETPAERFVLRSLELFVRSSGRI